MYSLVYSLYLYCTACYIVCICTVLLYSGETTEIPKFYYEYLSKRKINVDYLCCPLPPNPQVTFVLELRIECLRMLGG